MKYASYREVEEQKSKWAREETLKTVTKKDIEGNHVLKTVENHEERTPEYKWKKAETVKEKIAEFLDIKGEWIRYRKGRGWHSVIDNIKGREENEAYVASLDIAEGTGYTLTSVLYKGERMTEATTMNIETDGEGIITMEIRDEEGRIRQIENLIRRHHPTLTRYGERKTGIMIDTRKK